MDYLSESASTVTYPEKKLGKHVGLNASKRYHPMGFCTKSHPLKHGSLISGDPNNRCNIFSHQQTFQEEHDSKVRFAAA